MLASLTELNEICLDGHYKQCLTIDFIYNIIIEFN